MTSDSSHVVSSEPDNPGNSDMPKQAQDLRAPAAPVERALPPRNNIHGDRLTADLPPNEAMALAEFLKRIGYEDCAKFASPFTTYDGVSEADTIWSAVLICQRALARLGYAPR